VKTNDDKCPGPIEAGGFDRKITANILTVFGQRQLCRLDWPLVEFLFYRTTCEIMRGSVLKMKLVLGIIESDLPTMHVGIFGDF